MRDYEKIQEHICIFCDTPDMIQTKDGDHQDCKCCGAHYWFRDDDNSWRHNGPIKSYGWQKLREEFLREIPNMGAVNHEDVLRFFEKRTELIV